MRFLLLGKNGQVGQEIAAPLAEIGELLSLGRDQCDVTDAAAVDQVAAQFSPDVIINAAAYTAVDRAETERDSAFSVNDDAARILAVAARRHQALLLHYSSDYVFDGTKHSPYLETDRPNALSVYGQSKLAGEASVLAHAGDHAILRTSWVYGTHGGNFAKTILRLAHERDQLNVVSDQFGVPTSTALISGVSISLIKRWHGDRQQGKPFPSGLFHLAPSGETNWYNYAKYVVNAACVRGLKLKLTPTDIRPISTADYRSAAPRPLNSRLDTSKLRNTFGVVLPSWDNDLNRVLDELFELAANAPA